MPRTRKARTVTVEYLDENTDVNIDNILYFVGIDPSYSSTGLVVLDNKNNEPVIAMTIKAGVPTERFHDRIKKLLDKLAECILKYNLEDVYVVMEGASFASEFNAFKLGKLSGVVEFFLGENKVSYSLVAPTYVKKVASGSGNANKEQVIKGVRERWGYRHSNSDINDAYTMAQIARGAKPLPRPAKKLGGRKDGK